jgi:hypothetical protein
MEVNSGLVEARNVRPGSLIRESRSGWYERRQGDEDLSAINGFLWVVDAVDVEALGPAPAATVKFHSSAFTSKEGSMFCPQCQQPVVPEGKFCSACGAALDRVSASEPEAGEWPAQHFAPMAPKASSIEPRESHGFDSPAHRSAAKKVHFIAWCLGVVGLLFLLAAILELFPRTPAPGVYTPKAFNSANPAVALVTLMLFVLPCLAVFWGLKHHKPWGRTMTLMLAMLTIVSPLSWFIVWVLTRREAKDLFGLTEPAGEASGLGKLAKAVGYVIVVLINVGLISGVIQDIAHPPTKVIPIADVATALGGNTVYCGMDASGKLIPNSLTVNIEGVITSIKDNPRSYMLEDGSHGGITVAVNQQFPMPAVGQAVQIMGVVQCPPPEIIASNLFHEIGRFPSKMAPDQIKAISTNSNMPR